MKRPAIATLLTLALTACGSDVVIRAQPYDDDPPPTVPDPPPEDPPPKDPPEDPPVEPSSCALEVSVEQIGGVDPCGYGGVTNLNPGTLLSVEPAPAVDGLRFEMQGCPAGEDCVCAITISCVGTDIAAEYVNATPTPVQAWIQPDELSVGVPGPWECLDCGYGPPFFHAATQLASPTSGGTLSVEAGAITAVETVDGTTYQTHALDGVAYEIGGLAPVQIPLGDGTASEGQTVVMYMDDDAIGLSLRNLRSTWCTDDCAPDDPPIGSADWVVFGPAY